MSTPFLWFKAEGDTVAVYRWNQLAGRYSLSEALGLRAHLDEVIAAVRVVPEEDTP